MGIARFHTVRQLYYYLFALFFLTQVEKIYSQTSKIDSLKTLIAGQKLDTNYLSNCNVLSKILLNNGNYEDAHNVIEKCINASNKIEKENTSNPELIKFVKKARATAIGNKGIIHFYKSEFKEAINKFSEAFEIDSIVGDKKGQARRCSSIGSAYSELGNYPKAMFFHTKALKFAEEIKDPRSIIMALGNLGIEHHNLRDTLNALECYKRAYGLSKVNGIKNSQAVNAGNIGTILMQRKILDSALIYFKEAVELNKEVGNLNGVALHLSNEAGVLVVKEDYENAIRIYLEALEMQIELRNVHDQSYTLGNIGSTYIKLRKFNEAKKYLLQAIDLAKKVNGKSSLKSWYYSLYQAEKNLSNFDLALDAFQLHTLYKDSLFNEDVIKQTEKLKSEYEFSKKEVVYKSNQEKAQFYLLSEKEKNRKNSILYISAILLVILVALATIFYLRYRQKLKENKFLQNEKELFEEQETNKRRLAELELIAIQAQMNPHFVFNSLNSIKFYISNNESEKAEEYIDHFSFLIRSFLEYSTSDVIKLENEVEILVAYLELEKMRLREKFKYEIDLPGNIKELTIPTFLIQPFLENSIKHGITPSSKNCLVTLKFELKENSVYITIDDNGIGVNTSKSKKANQLGHVSKGLSIIKEKVDVNKKLRKSNTEFEIIDKSAYNEQGTVVKIRISMSL